MKYKPSDSRAHHCYSWFIDSWTGPFCSGRPSTMHKKKKNYSKKTKQTNDKINVKPNRSIEYWYKNTKEI